MLVKLAFVQLQPPNLTITAIIVASNIVNHVGIIIFVTLAPHLLYQISLDPVVGALQVKFPMLRVIIVFVVLVQFYLVPLVSLACKTVILVPLPPHAINVLLLIL